VPIAFDCTCGKTLRVPDNSAGKRAKCPACGAVVSVPGPEPEFEIVEEPPEQPTAAPAPKPPDSSKPRPGSARLPTPKPVDDDDSDEGTYKIAR
jgi:hypothetical protein